MKSDLPTLNNEDKLMNDAGKSGNIEFAQKPYSLRYRILAFDAISLGQIKNISLMDRIDTKFVFPRQLLQRVIHQLSDFYNILEIKDNRIFTYQNVYWDTPDFKFYHNHHNGKLNRYKVRYRRYRETRTTFLEVKFKTNKKRTIKERISVHGLHKSMPQTEHSFLMQRLPSEFHDLQPSLIGTYRRITFASKTSQERVTIDFDARFKNPMTGQDVHLKNLIIAEVKQSKALTSSRFLEIMRQYRLQPTSFSKYCIGCCMTAKDSIKTNRFKLKLRGLNQIERRINKNGSTESH